MLFRPAINPPPVRSPVFVFLAARRRAFSLVTKFVVAAVVAAFAPTLVGAQGSMAVKGVAATRFLSYYDEIGELRYAVDFTVKNEGTTGAYAYVYYSCGPYAREDGQCEGQDGSIGWLNPGQSRTATGVVVTYGSPESGIITLGAAPSPSGGWHPGMSWDVGRASFSMVTLTATFLTSAAERVSAVCHA